jgi:hypothetical protein
MFNDQEGQPRKKTTTRGWQFLLSWKDRTSSWVWLKDIKDSFRVQVVDYAKGNGLMDEPASALWCPYVLRKCKCILAKVKTKYWRQTHTFGIRLPKTVAEAYKYDKEDNMDFWRKSVEKEMKNVWIAFKFNDDDKIPIGYKVLTIHMVFDIKMDSLTRKARLVATGSKTSPLKNSTYYLVVSRDLVRLFFLLAALNDLDVLSADIKNTYLSAPIHPDEKYWIKAGPEFGSDERRPAMVVRALYGLCSSVAQFHVHLANVLQSVGYQSCKTDLDVWIRAAVKTDDTKYYKYVLCYVDDILCCSKWPDIIMEKLGKLMEFKEGSVAEPTLYLGTDIKKWNIEDSDAPTKTR